jgi:hypothetical protein
LPSSSSARSASPQVGSRWPAIRLHPCLHDAHQLQRGHDPGGGRRGYSGALTTTYTLDGTGEATQITDGLGDTSSATYDADHDVLTSTDATSNVTTNAYQYVEYVGPNGRAGFPIVQQPTLLNTVEKAIGQ